MWSAWAKRVSCCGAVAPRVRGLCPPTPPPLSLVAALLASRDLSGSCASLPMGTPCSCGLFASRSRIQQTSPQAKTSASPSAQEPFTHSWRSLTTWKGLGPHHGTRSGGASKLRCASCSHRDGGETRSAAKRRGGRPGPLASQQPYFARCQRHGQQAKTSARSSEQATPPRYGQQAKTSARPSQHLRLSSHQRRLARRRAPSLHCIFTLLA